MPQLDPIALTQDLIRRPSVTPADEGAMDIVQRTLEGLGFACRRMKFGEIENLYARYGTASPNLCFAGHTDVVPVGDAAASVTVIAADAMHADAWATALTVMGAKTGLEFARRHALAARFVTRDGDRLREAMTAPFEAHLAR